MSARARHLSVLLAVLLAVATPLAMAAASGPGNNTASSTYRVKNGDTITSIAVQLRLSGGWQQLYQANQDRIGPDPNRLEVGTELTVPQGAAVPAGEGYVVRPGDSLNSIAGRLHVAGGGNALYAANRNVIGPDPNRLEVGQTLLPPGAPHTTAVQAPKASVPSAALDRPAAPAPVAAGPTAAGSSVQAADSGNGKTVLWSVLAGLLFVAFIVLVLLGLPRWRRASGSQEIWVGGDYSADNQPVEPVKPRLWEQLGARFSRPTRSGAAPVSQSGTAATTALAEVRHDPTPVAADEPQRNHEPQQAHLDEPDPIEGFEPIEGSVRLIDDWPAQPSFVAEPEVERVEQPDPAAQAEPADQAEPASLTKKEPAGTREEPPIALPQPTSASEPSIGTTPPVESTPQEPLAPRLVRSVVAGLQPSSVARQSRPRRQRARSLLHAAVSGLRDEGQRHQPAAGEGGLADELLGEVRLVDPSTPLTKDQRRGGDRGPR